jgi:hypothetical protein
MTKLRSILACAALAAGLALAAASAGCGTSTTADTAASTPAASHFKADLASGYLAVQAVRISTTNALVAGIVTKAQAQAVQDQCKAFTATLDGLRAIGESTSTQSTLTATLQAISAATIFVTATQGGSS